MTIVPELLVGLQEGAVFTTGWSLCGDALFAEQSHYEHGKMRWESDSNWAALLAWRKSRAYSIRIKIRNQANWFRIFTHQEDQSIDP